MRKLSIVIIIAFCLVFVPARFADEGMWTFDNPPLKQWKEKYGSEQALHGEGDYSLRSAAIGSTVNGKPQSAHSETEKARRGVSGFTFYSC